MEHFVGDYGFESSGLTDFRQGFFHHTPSRRLFESPDAIVAACVGVAGGVLLTRFLITPLLTGRAPVSHPPANHACPPGALGNMPPISWLATANLETCDEVETVISAGFEMARRTKPCRRNRAFREASFQAPHEFARLNPDAPRFRVEDMGPMPPLKTRFREMGKIGFHVTAPFDVEEEARVFLHFPNDASKATAAFLAINYDLGSPRQPLGHRHARGNVPDKENEDHDPEGLFAIAVTIWICQTVNWRRHHPDVLDRIEPGHLPVIINFRGTACSSIWDTRAENFLGPQWESPLIDLTKLSS